MERVALIFSRLNERARIVGARTTSTMVISYEMVWAMPRRPPKKAYFELEAQANNKVLYTDSLLTQIKKINPEEMKNSLD